MAILAEPPCGLHLGALVLLPSPASLTPTRADSQGHPSSPPSQRTPALAPGTRHKENLAFGCAKAGNNAPCVQDLGMVENWKNLIADGGGQTNCGRVAEGTQHSD